MSVRVLDYKQLQLLPEPEWLIDNVIPTGPGGSLGILFGKPGAGKSFVALDIAHCIATGTPWHGRPVTPDRVVYNAAEGALGYKKRSAAWAKHHGFNGNLPRTHYALDTVNLMDLGSVERLLDAIGELPTPPGLVVIDTLARSMAGGDENETKDMNQAVLGAQRIQTLNCSVLLVHHLGYAEDQSRPRGSSALVGAADYMIKVEKSGGAMTITCAKQKDAEEFLPIYLDLVPCGGSAVLTAGGNKVTRLRRA